MLLSSPSLPKFITLQFDMNYEVMLFVCCVPVVDDNVVKVVFRCSCCFIVIVIEN